MSEENTLPMFGYQHVVFPLRIGRIRWDSHRGSTDSSTDIYMTHRSLVRIRRVVRLRYLGRPQ